MANNSKIEWTATVNPDGSVSPGATWNPVRGCSKVSEGCRHCYAMNIAARFAGAGLPYEGLAERRGGLAQWTNRVMLVEDSLNLPLTWKKPKRIFVNSMSDLFHEQVPQEFIYRVSLVMLKAHRHTYQILTKRPERMANIWLTSLHCEWLREALGSHLLTDANIQQSFSHVWIGTSVEDQATADERIPHLLKVPARVRFLSCEPLLGAVDLRNGLRIAWKCSGCRRYFSGQLQELCPNCGQAGYWTGSHAFNPKGGQVGSGISWVICGGESGPHARPMHPDWPRELRDQCQAAGVPFFFKQHGEWLDGREWPDYRAGEFRGQTQEVEQFYSPRRCQHITLCRVGKHAAGRQLDGRTWDEFPGGTVPGSELSGDAFSGKGQTPSEVPL